MRRAASAASPAHLRPSVSAASERIASQFMVIAVARADGTTD